VFTIVFCGIEGKRRAAPRAAGNNDLSMGDFSS
jgi:hypothetical protein